VVDVVCACKGHEHPNRRRSARRRRRYRADAQGRAVPAHLAVEGCPFVAARITRIDEPQRASEVLMLLTGVPAKVAQALQARRNPPQLADVVAGLLDSEIAEKQMLLEAPGTEERLAKLLEVRPRHIQVLRLCKEIGERTKKDLREVPEATRSAIEFVWLEHADDALRAALTGSAAPRSLAFG
jgi:uncharacterized protein HemY